MKLSTLFLLAGLLFSQNIFASDRFSLLTFHPTPDGGTFFTVRESANLKSSQFNFGTSLDYAHKPLKAVFGSDNVLLSNHLLTQNFYGAVGVTNWASMAVTLPTVWNEDFRNPDTLSSVSNEMGVGDLQLELKFKVLDRKKNFIGLGFVPFVSFPTGRENIFIGDDGVMGGGKIIFDKQFGERFTTSLNLGGLARKKVDAYGLSFGHQFLMSGGVAYKAANFLSVVGESEVTTPFADFFQTQDTSPIETRAGLKWSLGKNQNYVVNTGASFGINYGSAIPQYRGFASFSTKLPYKKSKSSSAKKGEIAQPLPVIHFAFASSRVSKNDQALLRSVVEVLSKNNQQIILAGYTDSVGSKSANKTLGLKRAQAVRKILIEMGIDKKAIEVISHGEDAPVASNEDVNGRIQNRRVEIQMARKILRLK